MSLSTTAFTDRIFPPGSLEFQQQERLRRINRITQERENQRIQGLYLRELRQQQHHEFGVRKALNNNTQISSPSVALKRTTSAKSPGRSPSAANGIKKSKSSTAKVKVIPILPGRVKSEASTSKKAPKKVPKKTKSKAGVTRKASLNLQGLSRKTSFTVRKISMPTASSLAKAKTRVLPTVSTKSSFTPPVPLGTKLSKTAATKVSFSGTAKQKCSKDFFCPVTTPVSILKNRKRIENMVKSSLAVSQEALTANPNPQENVVVDAAALVTRVPEVRIPYKPIPPTNPPPQPNIGICKAFPGTKEWEEYWSRFSKAMDKYNKEMSEYEQRAAETFRDDLARYSEETQKVNRERDLYKTLGVKGVELGVIPPPPIMSKELNGLQLFNGYIIKSKGMKGQVSNLPGSPTGIRFEVDVRGEQPNKVHIQKDHNLLTVTLENGRFLRIGTPSGKLAGDMQVWPPIDGIIIIDAP